MTDRFTGAGWRFPLSLDAQGRMRRSGEAEAVRQSIWTILSTAPGERIIQPDFGCDLYSRVFAPNSSETAGRVSQAVVEALVRWEPRIDLLDVYAAPDPQRPSLLLIDITYQLRRTNSRFNLVYPFYTTGP